MPSQQEIAKLIEATHEGDANAAEVLADYAEEQEGSNHWWVLGLSPGYWRRQATQIRQDAYHYVLGQVTGGARTAGHPIGSAEKKYLVNLVRRYEKGHMITKAEAKMLRGFIGARSLSRRDYKARRLY